MHAGLQEKWEVTDSRESVGLFVRFFHLLLLFELKGLSLWNEFVPHFVFRFRDPQELQGPCLLYMLWNVSGPSSVSCAKWALDKIPPSLLSSPKLQNSPPTTPPEIP